MYSKQLHMQCVAVCSQMPCHNGLFFAAEVAPAAGLKDPSPLLFKQKAFS